MNQRELARGLGLSPAAVCRAIKRGMPAHSVEAARAWRASTVAPYARSGAGSQGAPPPTGAAPARGGLNLADERAALAREQRIGIRMKNAIARREYAPVEYLTLTLAAASSAFVEHLDHVPARLRREHPDLPAAALDAVLKTLADARNAFCDAAEELMTERMPRRGDFDTEDDEIEPED